MQAWLALGAALCLLVAGAAPPAAAVALLPDGKQLVELPRPPDQEHQDPHTAIRTWVDK